MTHEDAFIDAIRAAPQDEPLQLMYADWLEERGDASAPERAEFLRTQSEIRRRMRERNSTEREALSVRLRQLRATLDPTWLALLHKTKVPLYPPHFAALHNGWRTQFAELEVPLRRYLNEPIPGDWNDPDWRPQLRPTPLQYDRNLRQQFRNTVQELVTAYLEGDSRQCGRVRALVRENTAVRWYLHAPVGATRKPYQEVRLLRSQLAILSLRDQEEDMRDEILELERVLAGADKARVDACPHLEEIAAVSSPVDRMGMGSMRELFERKAKRRMRRPRRSDA